MSVTFNNTINMLPFFCNLFINITINSSTAIIIVSISAFEIHKYNNFKNYNDQCINSKSEANDASS